MASQNQNKNMTGSSRRHSTPPGRFADETFLPGSNNAHTAGRKIDPYDRKFNAWEIPIEEDRYEDWYDTTDPFVAPEGDVDVESESEDDEIEVSGREQKYDSSSDYEEDETEEDETEDNEIEVKDDSGREQKYGDEDEDSSSDYEEDETEEDETEEDETEEDETEEDETESEEGEEHDGVFEVEKVIGTRLGEDGREYKIRWKGYGSEDDTWEHYKNLDCPDALDVYWQINNIESVYASGLSV